MRENLTYGLMRGRWRRNDGRSSMGTKLETADTTKGKACTSPRQCSTLHRGGVFAHYEESDISVPETGNLFVLMTYTVYCLWGVAVVSSGLFRFK